MKSSCIRQPENDRFIQIHLWQIQMCQGNHCAALLLAFFIGWHDWKIKHDEYYKKFNDIAEMHGEGRPHTEDAYLYFSMEQFIEGCMGFYGKKTINEALDFLISLKIITVHKNPNKRYHFDKTKYFKFYPSICNDWINNSFPHQDAHHKKSQVVDSTDSAKKANAFSKNALPSSKNNLPSSKNARYITNNTNNTTNKNQSIKNPSDFFDDEKNQHCERKQKSTVEVEKVMELLKKVGMPAKRFDYPDIIETIQNILDQGASERQFVDAYNIAHQATKGKGFGVNYLVQIVQTFLTQEQSLKNYLDNLSKPEVEESRPKFESDLRNAQSWAGDILEQFDKEDTVWKQEF